MIEEGVTTISFSCLMPNILMYSCAELHVSLSEGSYFGSSCEKSAPLQSI